LKRLTFVADVDVKRTLKISKVPIQAQSSLKGTGGHDGASMTLPASYWYLQHFDLENLHKNVDFVNIMSYHLHEKWDIGNEWLDPVLNSYTSLTEITNALFFIWRNMSRQLGRW
jgi:chitinase